MTAYCVEDDADIEALEKAPYVSDQGESVNGFNNDTAHVLPHPPCYDNKSKTTPRTKTVMAFRHEDLPLWGVQFHPESICTEHGVRMISNFCDLTVRWMNKVGLLNFDQPFSKRNRKLIYRSYTERQSVAKSVYTIRHYELVGRCWCQH